MDSFAIINGESSDNLNTVALVRKSDHSIFCSGVLVSPRLVLTAAHCLSTRGRNKVNPKDIGIHLGNGSATGRTVNFVAAKRTEFRKYYKNNSECDFGFVELESDISGTQLEIASEEVMVNYFNQVHPELMYVGFGEDENRTFGVKKSISFQIESIPEKLHFHLDGYQYKGISVCTPPYSLESEECYYALHISDNYDSAVNIHRSRVFKRSKFNAFSVFSIDQTMIQKVYGVGSGDSGGPLFIKIGDKILLAAINVGGDNNHFFSQSVSVPIYSQMDWLQSKIRIK